MLNCGISPRIVSILKYWSENQKLITKWGNEPLEGFRCSNGIKQGRLLSPLLFNLHIIWIMTRLISIWLVTSVKWWKLECQFESAALMRVGSINQVTTLYGPKDHWSMYVCGRFRAYIAVISGPITTGWFLWKLSTSCNDTIFIQLNIGKWFSCSVHCRNVFRTAV